jgi:glycine cleavage system H lipoate-binding protein
MTMGTLTPQVAGRGAARCIWMQTGVVPCKKCLRDFDCRECAFDLALRRVVRENEARKRNGMPPAAGRRAAIVFWQEQLSRLPLRRRPCLHHMKGRIAFRACTGDYRCGSCDFDQYFNDQYAVFARVRPVSALNIHGVRLPQGVYLHPGHCWVSLEEEETVRIGLDDFSLRVLAPLDCVEAPLVGKRLHQNRPAIGLRRGERHAWALAPVDGVVTEVNPRLREEGVPAGADGYADRWVLRAHARQLRTNLHDLMIGEQASAFMQTEIERLLRKVEEKTGPLAADGGELGSDIYGHLPQLGWDELAAAFLRA